MKTFKPTKIIIQITNLFKMLTNSSNQSSFKGLPPSFLISTEDISTFRQHNTQMKGKKVITHSGHFHADEVLACFLVRYITGFSSQNSNQSESGYWIIRSRNKEIFREADLILDVGGIYDPLQMKYDHHMDYFKETLDDSHKIKLSAAGLIYKHHGMDIVSNILKEWGLFNSNNQKNLAEIYKLLYESFIAYVDGNDNGVNQYEDCKCKMNYKNNTSFHNRIDRLNPSWGVQKLDQTEQFKKAIQVAGEEFFDQLSFIVNSYIPAYSRVHNAFINRLNINKSGRIMLLEGNGCPWKEHLYRIEEKYNLSGQVQFVLIETSHEGYRVCTVPESPGSFKFRKGLVKSWRGVTDDKLPQLSGIEDIIFVHPSGFIGGAKSYNSALKMAIKSVEEDQT